MDKRVITANSSTILTGLGLIGLGFSTYFVVKGTEKAIAALDYEWDQLSEKEKRIPFTTREKVKICWKYYIPAAIALGCTITCFIGANRIAIKHIKQLTALYSASQATASALEKKLVEKIGDKKVKEAKGEIAKEQMEVNPSTVHNTYVTGKYSDNLVYDYMSGRYFYMDQVDLDTVFVRLSNTVQRENYITMNEVYDEIGIPRIGLGDEIQIDVDDTDKGMIDVEFHPEFSEANRKIVTVMKIRTSMRSYRVKLY